jgi:hypothetical protein
MTTPTIRIPDDTAARVFLLSFEVCNLRIGQVTQVVFVDEHWSRI